MKTEKIDYSKEYPELSEDGQKRTQEIIDRFAKQLFELMNESVSNFTKNLAMEIVNDDAWIDLRYQTLSALCNYTGEARREKQFGTYLGQWWVGIRKKILEENKEAIINDIITDKENKIKDLEAQINNMQERQRIRF